MTTPGRTSCIRSLSDEDDGDVSALGLGFARYVAMRSSASYPSCSMQAMLKARTASGSAKTAARVLPAPAAGAPCNRRRSGVAERLAPASKMTAMCVGASEARLSTSSFHRIAQKPCTAPTRQTVRRPRSAAARRGTRGKCIPSHRRDRRGSLHDRHRLAIGHEAGESGAVWSRCHRPWRTGLRWRAL